MADRAEIIADFLARAGWGTAARAPLAGDASNRSYLRLTNDAGETAVLMDAPPDTGEDVRPFAAIARHLRGLGLSAPEILAADADAGLLLLEDLGDGLFSAILRDEPSREMALYENATDLLIALRDAPVPDVPRFDAARMTDITLLAFETYRPTGAPVDHAARDRFSKRFSAILERHVQAEPVLLLRDYHADNLLWLPARDGLARVGLLDFQDAVAGHPAYDLVSLLQDIRRQVTQATQQAMIARYVSKTGSDKDKFDTVVAVLGAQRALRILAVFARLGKQKGRPHYVDMIPRVWEILQANLQHPALEPVADLLATALPAPDVALLQDLKTP